MFLKYNIILYINTNKIEPVVYIKIVWFFSDFTYCRNKFYVNYLTLLSIVFLIYVILKCVNLNNELNFWCVKYTIENVLSAKIPVAPARIPVSSVCVLVLLAFKSQLLLKTTEPLPSVIEKRRWRWVCSLVLEQG